MGHSGDSNAELISIQILPFYLFKNFIPAVFPFTGRIITLPFVPEKSYVNFQDWQNIP